MLPELFEKKFRRITSNKKKQKKRSQSDRVNHTFSTKPSSVSDAFISPPNQYLLRVLRHPRFMEIIFVGTGHASISAKLTQDLRHVAKCCKNGYSCLLVTSLGMLVCWRWNTRRMIACLKLHFILFLSLSLISTSGKKAFVLRVNN